MKVALPLKEMSTAEKIGAMEEIWDSLCHESVPVESPAWHQAILDERMAHVRSGQAKFLTLQELKDRNQ